MTDLKKMMEQLVDLGIEFQDINDAYIEAFHAKEARDRKAAELNNKREVVVNALNDYVEAIYGTRMSVNDLKELSTQFQTIEESVAALENSSVQFTRDEQEKKEKEKSDEEKLRDFLRAVLGE